MVIGSGVGGLTAAALLARCLKQAGTRVTVVEPPAERGLGVGEATIPSVLRLLANLGADEAEMMRALDVLDQAPDLHTLVTKLEDEMLHAVK